MPAHDARSVLQELGMSDKEIDIYLLLLTVGTAPASVLGQRTGIQRSTAQYTCQQLAKQGIITMVEKGNAYLYTAEAPEKILLLLEKQRSDLGLKEQRVHQILPELKQLRYAESVLPRVRFFEGADGVLQAYRMIVDELRPGEEVLSYVNPITPEEDHIGLLPVIAEYEAARREKGVKARFISVDCPAAREWMKENETDTLNQVRIMPGKFRFSAAENILYKNKISSMNVGKNVVFASIVQNESIMNLQANAFEALWKAL